MKHITFAVPGELETPTGGYAYDRRVVGELRAMGWTIDVLNIGEHFPHPTVAQRADAERQLAAASTQHPLIVDGLAFGALADAAATLSQTHALIALVHHPLAMEQGLSAGQTAALRTSERIALAAAHHVIVTSPFTARVLAADYEVPPNKITVAQPGTERAEWSAGSGSDAVHLLSVGSVVPRKGYDTLVAALAKVSDLPWRLTIAGDTTRSRDAMAQLERMIEQARLGQRIKFTGALDENALAAAYRFADMFVLASRFEGYGMAAASAVAHGLPIVGTRGGALVDTIGETGLLVAPDDISALAAALRKAISDEDVRLQLRVASRAAAQRLPTWRRAAETIAAAIETAR